MCVVTGCMKIVQRITGWIKVVKTDFVTPVWISLVRYLCYGFRKVEYICASPLWPYDNICDAKFIPLCRASKAACNNVCGTNAQRKVFIGERKLTGRLIIEIRN